MSVVRKLKPEDLLPKWIAVLADIGNRKANKFWEFNMKSSERPKEESDDKEWLAFLQKKYIEKAWIDSKDKKVQEHEDEVYVLFFFFRIRLERITSLRTPSMKVR